MIYASSLWDQIEVAKPNKNRAIGRRCGEQHQHARLSDADVELIRDIYETGLESYLALARAFGVSKESIRDIVTYRRRCDAATQRGRRTPPKSRAEQLGIIC